MKDFKIQGYKIINNIYSITEINEILSFIKKKRLENKFGIREFLKSNKELMPLIFNQKLNAEINRISKNAQLIKSIYFDKPPNTNWIVNWHQDLTINLKEKIPTEGFKNWRILKDRTVVQPSIELLENIFTIRIHLDKCTKENGALRLIRESHSKGIIDVRNGVEKYKSQEEICEIEMGGILVMRPLILHASKRTENQKNRRVIHIEFSNIDLPNGLKWNENITL